MKDIDRIIKMMGKDPEFITITRNKLTWWRKILYKLGFKGVVGRTFQIKPLNLFNKFRISSIAEKFDLPVDLSVENVDGKLVAKSEGKEISLLTAFNSVKKNTMALAKIIGILLQGDNKKLSNKLLRYIINNLTDTEMTLLMPKILNGLNLGFFLAILALISRENLLKS